jgi:hypothetical protein
MVDSTDYLMVSCKVEKME